MFGRQSFGVSQPSSFGGFGTTSNAPFGQNQLFGNTAPGTFGTGTTTSGFGSSTQPMFGAQQSAAPLFGTSTSTFGQANQSGFGSSLFGNAQPQPSGSGLFGSSGSTAFGQQNKPNGFGFSASTSGGLFGQSVQPPQQSSSVFQPAPSGGLFGSSGAFGASTAPTGTAIKFSVVTGTDSMQKSGVAHTISTKHHCITCMKEYENKSLEELRWEDYQCNRKGPQQQTGFGATPAFGQTGPAVPSLFGQAENKTMFGQPSGFGQTGFGLTSQNTAQNIFGKPTAFGTPATTSTFGFGTNTPSSGGLFGTTTPAKPFGTPATQSLFGVSQNQPSSGFVTSSLFGQPNTQNTSGIFGKPAQPTGFNAGQTGFTFGSSQPAQSSLFQAQKPNTGFNIFGQSTATGAFGQQQPAFGSFNAFGKPSQSLFGQPTQTTFGGLGTQPGGSIFGTAAKPNLFVSGGTSNLFGNNTFQPNTGFAMPTQQQQPQPQTSASPEPPNQGAKNIKSQSDPYGFSPHFEGLSPSTSVESASFTNPKVLQKLLDYPQTVSVPITKRMKLVPAANRKESMFDSALDKYTSSINFSLRSSAKRLVIKNKERVGNFPTVDDVFSEFGSSDDTRGGSDTPEVISTETQTNGRGPNLVPVINLSEIDNNDYDQLPTDRGDTETTLPNLESTDVIVHAELNTSTTDYTSCETTISESDDIVGSRDTCGIVLTKPEYYTIPPLESLSDYKRPDGFCYIRGFTVGRYGYGCVTFPDLVNVSNLNLDETVQFRYREVTIYPDDSKKPPVGHGLNRPARVTLDRVFPKASDGNLITDLSVLRALNFVDTLKTICDRHGSKFMEYRSDTGSWLFSVEHFTKYGLSDSDDVEIYEKLQKLQAKQTRGFMKTKFKPVEDLDAIQEVSEQETEAVQTPTTKHPEYPHRRKGLGGLYETRLSEIPENVEDVEMISPGPTPSPHLHPVETRKALYKTRGSSLYTMKATFYDDVGSTTGYKEFAVIDPSEKYVADIVKSPAAWVKKQVPSTKPGIFRLYNKSCIVPIEKSLFNCRNYMDIAVFKSRSFKVGWGKGLVLATTLTPRRNEKHLNATTLEKWSTTVTIMDVSDIVEDEAFVNCLPKHLEIVLEMSKVEMIEGAPLFTPKLGKPMLVRHHLLASEATERNVNSYKMRYYTEIWELCVAFWGHITYPDTRTEYFSRWLENASSFDVYEDLRRLDIYEKENAFDVLFLRLSAHQVERAAEFAVMKKMPKLSMLLSQLNLNSMPKSLMQLQMRQWETSLCFDHIHPVARKIYTLLSGNPVTCTSYFSGSTSINVCEKLDWRRALAMHLWYIASDTDRLTVALNLYKEAFAVYGYAARPTSKYSSNADVFDIQYYLMLLFSDNRSSLEQILNPDTHSGYPFDYKMSWLLLQTLSSLEVGTISDKARTYITTSFSHQLESLGLYKWAVFVLLFLSNSQMRKTLVMRVLHRHLPDDFTDLKIEDEIVRDLHVPAAWIHEVKACKTQLLSRHWETYKHLALTHKWHDSHYVGVTYVFPDLMVNEKYDILLQLLGILERDHRLIANWNKQGGLLLQFLRFIREMSGLNVTTRDEALRMHSKSVEICGRVTYFPRDNVNQIACISEVSKRCARYLKPLLSLIQPNYYGIISTSAAIIGDLIMPPDYKMDELLRCTAVFFERR